ncbi:uncharacterized protein TM35_000024560 [Trypanosoma theileri]|uniref:Uncharacterized protein n=1 Tax=Trypanosoma theileri TaxID=67003 RepID=A0A1X0P9J9_9TRYP|nr:uncharacterized protein TM35_000024560 [Trypanosoma theileri]ORC93130.1 hypothetical protein TM35_000024560 [Trypanosoma theileri]
MRSTLSFSQLVNNNNNHPNPTGYNGKNRVYIDNGSVAPASCGETGDAVVLAPTKRTWFDSSPPTKRNQFVFPSNRSDSGSVPPPNGSASPVDCAVRPSEMEGIGSIDAMRKELIRLYDSNMELRAQMKRLQTCVEKTNVVQITELEKPWRTRCTELETALREEQRQNHEKDELIAALQKELTIAKRMMTTMLTSKTPHKESTKNTNNARTEPRTFREVQRFVTPSYHKDTPLVQQAEKAMSKVRLGHSNRVNIQVLPEKQITNQLPSRSQSTSKCIHSSQSQIIECHQNINDENVNKETVFSVDNPSNSRSHSSNITKPKPLQQEEQKVAAAVAVTPSSSSLLIPQTGITKVVAIATTTRTPHSSSSRSFVPQTLADLSASDAITPSKKIAKPWYDEDEVKEVVMSSRASRLRLVTSPRRLLRQGQIDSLLHVGQLCTHPHIQNIPNTSR